MKEIFEKILQSFKSSRAKYMKIDLGWKKYIEFEKKSDTPVSVQVQRVEGGKAVKEESAIPTDDDQNIRLLSFYVGIFKQVKETLSGEESVKKGEILGTIESMGIVHEVESPVNGKIVEVNIKDKDIVEYEQLLFKVREEK